MSILSADANINPISINGNIQPLLRVNAKKVQYYDGNIWKDITSEFPRVRLSNSAVQAIANGAWTPIAFDTERWDNKNLHDTPTNNTIITIQEDGLYLITGGLSFAGTSSQGTRMIGIRSNGVNHLALSQFPGNGAYPVSVNVTTLYYLYAGIYVELCAFQNSGASINTVVELYHTPELALVKVA